MIRVGGVKTFCRRKWPRQNKRKKSGSNSPQQIFSNLLEVTNPKKHPQHKFPKHPFWCLSRFCLKRQGYGALEEGSLRGIMALDLYHFTGAQGNGQVAMRPTSVSWVEDGDGGGFIVFFLLQFLLKTKEQQGFSKPKQKKGYIRKEGIFKADDIGILFSSEKMGANFCTVVSDGSRGSLSVFS